MSVQYKSFPAYIKATDADAGIVEAIVSVFSNVDDGKERVRPGFFTASLARKFPKGVWMHKWDLPIAKTLEARELLPGDPLLPPELQALGGLYIKGQCNLDTQRGREAFSDLKFGTVDEFSIGYSVLEESYDKATGITDLITGELYEWSPVLVGMNRATALLGVKSAEARLLAPLQLAAQVKSLCDDDCVSDWEVTSLLFTLLDYVRQGRYLAQAEPAVLRQALGLLDEAEATLDGLLGAEIEDEADAGAAPTVSFASAAAGAVAATRGVLARAERHAAARRTDGRPLSAANQATIKQIQADLTAAAAQAAALLVAVDAATATPPDAKTLDPAAVSAAHLAFLTLEAKALGVPIP